MIVDQITGKNRLLISPTSDSVSLTVIHVFWWTCKTVQLRTQKFVFVFVIRGYLCKQKCKSRNAKAQIHGTNTIKLHCGTGTA